MGLSSNQLNHCRIRNRLRDRSQPMSAPKCDGQTDKEAYHTDGYRIAIHRATTGIHSDADDVLVSIAAALLPESLQRHPMGLKRRQRWTRPAVDRASDKERQPDCLHWVFLSEPRLNREIRDSADWKRLARTRAHRRRRMSMRHRSDTPSTPLHSASIALRPIDSAIASPQPTPAAR